MKVGLFFGSFNPIHMGHLIIAQSILNETDLHQVWLVVSPHNPFKKKETLLGEYDRLYMCELATAANHRIKPSNVEFKLPQPNYTIDTLTHLAARYPSYEFSLLMGADNLATLHKWKNYQAIINHYKVYVYPRLHPDAKNPPDAAVAASANIVPVQAPIVELSATRIRELIKQKKSVQHLVPDAVFAYIEKQNLYAD
jgi:nicotinate-nucleotide adenylyltransferase